MKRVLVGLMVLMGVTAITNAAEIGGKEIPVTVDITYTTKYIWRGIDIVEDSAYQLKEKYAFLDARKQLVCKPAYPPQAHHPSCLCHRIMLGEVEPQDCKLFKKACNPSKPFGPCMVSPEGTCHVRYSYSEIKTDFI